MHNYYNYVYIYQEQAAAASIHNYPWKHVILKTTFGVFFLQLCANCNINSRTIDMHAVNIVYQMITANCKCVIISLYHIFIVGVFCCAKV